MKFLNEILQVTKHKIVLLYAAFMLCALFNLPVTWPAVRIYSKDINANILLLNILMKHTWIYLLTRYYFPFSIQLLGLNTRD